MKTPENAVNLWAIEAECGGLHPLAFGLRACRATIEQTDKRIRAMSMASSPTHFIANAKIYSKEANEVEAA